MRNLASTLQAVPRALVAAFAGLLLALSLGGAWFYQDQESRARRRAEAELESIARLKAKQILEWRLERRGDAALLMDSPFFRNAVTNWLAADGAEIRDQILAKFQALRQNSRYRDVFLVDALGRVRLSLSSGPPSLHTDTLEALANAYRTRQPLLSDLHPATDGSAPKAEAIAPFFAGADPAAEPLGAVVLQDDALEFLYPVTQTWPTPSRTAETMFVRRDGADVLFLNETRNEQHAAFTLRIPLLRREVPAVRAVLGMRGVVEGVDYRGADVLAALVRIPDSPWFMVTKIDTEEALEEWQFRSWLILAVLVLLAGALAGTIGMIWQQRSKYLALARSAESLRQSEERLRDSARRIQMLWQSVEESPATIVITDTKGVIEYVNPKFCEVTGYAREDALGKNPRLLKSGLMPPELYRDMWKTITAGLNWHGEFSNRRKDASIFWEAATLSPVKNEQGVITHYLAIKTDITERKLAEMNQAKLMAELERSNRELEQFAYVASHDLQEPLRLVSAYTQLLVQRYRDKLDAGADPLVGFITEGVTRMQRLIQDLLAYSRVSSRNQTLARTSLERTLKEVQENLALAIRDQQAVITHDPLPEVMGDPTQLGQLFQNLIANAVKFRRPEEPPRIHVGAQPAEGGQALLFSVRDNGIGIEPEFFDRIFVIFQRLHSRKKYSGTGIGLAICKRIVERHGGHIWVESEKGRGTTFHFTLPNHAQP